MSNKLASGNNSKIQLPEGKARTMMQLGVEMLNYPKIDMNDVGQVNQRICDYLSLCGKYDLRPTVSGLAMALNGHSRQWLSSVVHDKTIGGAGYEANLPTEVADLIKSTHQFLNQMWEVSMQEGTINPVVGIFLGKNNFHYVDKTETVITPNTNLATTDAATIEAKYKELPMDTDTD